jgi:hypothetical protein
MPTGRRPLGWGGGALAVVVLGLINPLLALLPLVDAGPGADSDCAALMRDARAPAPAKPPAARKAPTARSTCRRGQAAYLPRPTTSSATPMAMAAALAISGTFTRWRSSTLSSSGPSLTAVVSRV